MLDYVEAVAIIAAAIVAAAVIAAALRTTKR
jgi:hypothetical protein